MSVFDHAQPETPEGWALDDDPDAAELRALIRLEAQRLRARTEARQIVAQERAGALQLPTSCRLDEFLAVPDPEVSHRIDGLWPVGGRVVNAAQYKAGKTTMVGNVIRSLVDGDPFLDRFAVKALSGNVVLLDDELDEAMLRRWLRDHDVRNADRVHVFSLRGKVASLNLLDEGVRARWAERLRSLEAEVVILDCLRPVLDALGLDESRDAGRFLVPFDAMMLEAQASEAMVVHHMGHAGERSRGDSRLRDWPDVEWTYVRDKDEQGDTDSDGPRYFAAYGRDVDQAEAKVAYDPATRRLSWAGGTRRDQAAELILPELLTYLGDNPGASQRGLLTGLAHHKRADVKSAIGRAIKSQIVRLEIGDRGTFQHYKVAVGTPTAPTDPTAPGRSAHYCASAPIGRTAHSAPPEHDSGAAQSPAEKMTADEWESAWTA